ncbi:MAG: restriction endonuclease subunit S, partial [Piscinibacter sp.]|uniref:restriction endonuclease subunit S n=1 Tax=Piscinibacter sp. TaxID=1903157 RepID=UPI001B54DA48
MTTPPGTAAAARQFAAGYALRAPPSANCRALKDLHHFLGHQLGKAASVGKVAIVDNDLDFNIWSPIALVRTSDHLQPKFLYYQLQAADCVGQILLLTNASSQGNIGMGDIEKLRISYPSVEEQSAIASVLSDMDAELTALESRRDKTRALKQGMMQELLTGRTRLV